MSTNFHKLTKRESQSLIALNAEALKVKMAWGDFWEVKQCLAPMCGEPDEMDHIKVCQFYETKWEESFASDSKEVQSTW